MYLIVDFAKQNNDQEKKRLIDPRDMVVGAGEGALGGIAVTNLERNVLHAPKGRKIGASLKAAGGDIAESFKKGNRMKTAKEAALAAGIGAVTTGIVGAGTNVIGKAFQKKPKYTTGTDT